MKEFAQSLVDRQVTHPLRHELSSFEQGVALVIVNRNGELLLGKEAVEDPLYGRRAGQWNIITETREPGERMKATVLRALGEELGVDLSLFSVVSGSYRETNHNYVQHMGYLYKYRCICLLFLGNPDLPAQNYFSSAQAEILFHQWVDVSRLPSFDIEYGARLVIDLYQNSG